jgi:two-component system, OmpR family, phosphate regulon response regulator PhoB
MPGRDEPRPIIVLVVDDDPEIRLLLTDLLRDEGFHAHTAVDTTTGLAAIEEVSPDVVLLDVGMPSMNGLDMLAEIRKRGDVPVILVTGRGGETDRVVGLRMGADDYVVKPFSGPELVARIHSVLRRSRPPQPTSEGDEQIDFGRLRVNTATREVILDDVDVPMTAREFDLLAFLVRSPRRVFTREQLLSNVWDSSTAWQDPATVTEHIRRIRRKIEDDPDEPRWLATVRGVGYRFEP